MKNTKKKIFNNINQSIFFTALFLITATVSFVLYAINFEHLSEIKKLMWFTTQTLTLLKPFLILHTLHYEEVDSQ